MTSLKAGHADFNKSSETSEPARNLAATEVSPVEPEEEALVDGDPRRIGLLKFLAHQGERSLPMTKLAICCDQLTNRYCSP